MPSFRSRAVLDLARGVRAFLSVGADITREGEPPVREAGGEPVPDGPTQETGKTEPGTVSREGDPPIFFLIGRSKSGTSWLMRLLNSHPEILCRGEGKLFDREAPNSLHGALARSEELAWWLGHNPWTRREQDPGLQEIFARTVSYVMRERLRKAGKRIVGDKSPFTSPGVVREIATLMPEARVVHIVRDGRDVAVSSVHHRWNNATDRGGHFALTDEQRAKREAYRQDPSSFGPGKESIFGDGHVEEIARSWSASVGRAISDAGLLGDGYRQVRYEDLLADPVGQTRRILRFLGAEADAKTAKRCVEAASFERLSGGRAQGEEDSSSFYRKGVAGDWRNHFTERDRRVFEEEAGELLVRLGYEGGDRQHP